MNQRHQDLCGHKKKPYINRTFKTKPNWMANFYPQKLLQFFFLAFTAVCCTTCESDMDLNGPANNHFSTVDLVTRVTASLVSGFVTDENESPVQSATVQVGNTTVSTDKYGHFEVRNISVVQSAATVTVTKQNYFKAIKTFVASDGKGVFFRIKLLPKTVAGTINAGSGGTVTLSNGLVISIPANSIVNAANNQFYSGSMKVMARLISAADPDLNRVMPGDLRGINSSNGLNLLITYGMAAVELAGSGGESLQIAPEKKATLTLPIPASLLANAPANIPLWYFDESNGLWKEEGSAAKTGNAYVGQVGHFSFWNFDTPSSFVMLNATIVSSTGGASTITQPLQNAKVKISEVGNPANYRYGYTDTAGYVSGPVPPNTQLLFEVYGNLDCATAVYSQNVTTATTNISLGTININNGNNIATLQGNVVNCSNAPVTNGYILVRSGNYYTAFRLSNTGSYSACLALCSGTGNAVTLIGEDMTGQQQSNPVNYTITPGINIISTLQTCTNTPSSAEFVHYVINGVPKNQDSPPYSLRMFQFAPNVSVGTYADPTQTIPTGNFSFSLAGLGVGSTQTLTTIAAPVGTGIGYVTLTINNPPVNVFITECGLPVTGYVAGNFSGNFTGPAPTNIQYNITCSFRVKRAP